MKANKVIGILFAAGAVLTAVAEILRQYNKILDEEVKNVSSESDPSEAIGKTFERISDRISSNDK